MTFVASYTLEGDASSLKSEVKGSVDEFQKLDAEADKAAASARQAAQGLDTVQTASARSTRAIAAQGGQLKMTAAQYRELMQEAVASGRTVDEVVAQQTSDLSRLRAAYDPLFAAQQRYRNQLAEIRAAHAAGALPEAQMRTAIARTKQSFAEEVPIIRSSTAALTDRSKAIQLQRWQLINLGQQVQDVGVSMAMGMNPALMIAQQGPQIVSATGGLRNFTALARQALTPMRIAVGGVTAALATGAAAWNSYLQSTKEVSNALGGTGRFVGETTGQLEAQAVAAAAAGDVSVREVRRQQAEFLRTGRIGAQAMQQLSQQSKDYAATMGMSLEEATADLAKKFADPVKGAEELNKSLGLLDDRSTAYVRTLVEQNRTEEAQLVLADALTRSTADYAGSVTALGRAWDWAARQGSNFWDATGGAINKAFDDPAATPELLARLKEQRDLVSSSSGPDYGGMRERSLAWLNAEIARIRRELDRTRSDAALARANRLASQAGTIGRDLTPGRGQLEELRSQQADLRDALADPAARLGLENVDQVQRAYDGLTRALDTYLTPAERLAEQNRIDAEALDAKTPAEKAAVAAARERLKLQGEVLPAAEADARVNAAAAKARTEATHAIAEENRQLTLNARLTLDTAEAWLSGSAAGQRAEATQKGLTAAVNTGADATARARRELQNTVASEAQRGAQSVASMTAEAQSRRLLNDAVLAGRTTAAQANQQLAFENQLRPLLIAQANAEGTAKKVLTGIIDELRTAKARLNDEEARSQAGAILTGQRDQIEILRRRQQLAGFGTGQTARDDEIAQLQLKQQLLAQNIDLESEEGRKILANSQAIQTMTHALERSGATEQAAMQLTSNALNSVTQNIAQGKLAWSDWGDLVQNVLQQVLQQVLQLAAIAPLMNSLFGTNYATLSDAGGIIGGLFHTGGKVGEPRNENRVVSPSMIAGAPRYHGGGVIGDLAPRERVIITEIDEEVLTKKSPRHIDNIGKYLSPRPSLQSRGEASNAGTSDRAPVAGGNVIVNSYPAPGTRNEVRTRKTSNGDTVIDIVGSEIKRSIASDIANGEGEITDALVGRFGLDRAAGLQG